MFARLWYPSVFVASLMISSPHHALAEDAIEPPKDAIPAENADTSPALPSMTFEDTQPAKETTTVALNKCFDAESLHPVNTAAVTLAIGFTPQGDLAKITINDGNGAIDEASRSVLAAALTALADCAPFGAEAGDVTYTITRGGFHTAEQDAATPPETSGADTGSASNPYANLLSKDPKGSSPDEPEQKEVAVEPSQQDMTDSEDAPLAETENELALLRSNISPGSEDIEAALELDLTARREIQRRLTLLEFSTNGVDGVFGPGTRAALTLWQESLEIEANGYLSQSQIAFLRQQSQNEYEKWTNRPKQYYGKKGCLREPSGKIVQGKSVRCDFIALGESF